MQSLRLIGKVRLRKNRRRCNHFRFARLRKKLAPAPDLKPARIRIQFYEQEFLGAFVSVAVEVALFSALTRLADRSLETDSWPPHPTDRWVY